MRPCIKPSIHVVRDGENACYFMMSERELFRCRGKTVPLLVDHVLPLLDGTRAMEEIGMALAATLPPQGLREVLQLLMSNHVVFDAAAGDELAPGDAERYAPLVVFFSRFTDRPHAFVQALRRARVVLAGEMPLLGEVVAALASCGIGALDVVSPEGTSVAVSEGTTVRVGRPGDLAEFCTGADLVVGLQDGEFRFLPELRALNRICLGAKQRLLHVRLTMSAEAWLGPVYAPGSACLECFENRLQTNVKTWKENQLYETQVKSGRYAAPRLELLPLVRQVAQMAALEVLHMASMFDTTRLVGRTRVVDLLTQESSVHTVLRYPRCPACSQLQVGRIFPWDEDGVQLDRMLLPREAAS